MLWPTEGEGREGGEGGREEEGGGEGRREGEREKGRVREAKGRHITHNIIWGCYDYY